MSVFPEKEVALVRELAKKYKEIAFSDKQLRANKRFFDSNDLKIVRPPVLIDEIPWYQIDVDGSLTCLCENPHTKSIEFYLRLFIFRNKYLNKVDMLIPPYFPVYLPISSTGMGINFVEKEERLTDNENRIKSHSYEDVMADESVLLQIHDPVLTAHFDAAQANFDICKEILGDTLDVKIIKYSLFGWSPWDRLARLRGIEACMMDMYDRPEYLHRILEKFVSAANAEIDFLEKNDLLEPVLTSLHCTPAYISGLEDHGLKSQWIRAASQSFGIVSPEMFKEFELDYLKPIAERFAYTYYGCCEPLDNKIQHLKSIKNLRKIGVSPWANVEVCAEQIGKDYVCARKPNPANVAIKTEPEHIRKEIEETVKLSFKYGCPLEFVLKDISTVSHRLENLTVWAETVSNVLDEYYDKA
ncbi:MAG: hypothetical protein IKA51_01905 [Clostridia bacterium]|nr:hypothetical protein [Clostridia bacterium]